MKRILACIRDIPLFAFVPSAVCSGTIPSFIFHQVEEKEFESFLRYLQDNHYRTIDGDELFAALMGTCRDTEKRVILTFDDGLRNVWAVAYPLLKRYGMKAVFYVNPSTVLESGGCGHCLEDVWAGKVSLADLITEAKERPHISWDEARAMEASGFVKIESHGWRHQICFTEDTIIDFQHPDRNGNPRYRWLFSAVDAPADARLWGAPVYPFRSRFDAVRYFDDAGLRGACMRFVEDNGGRAFFERSDWRTRLTECAREYRENNRLRTVREDWISQELAIRDSLVRAKEKIEKELGKNSLHFAYPWSIGGPVAQLWLKELGYKTVFRYMSSWKLNRTGSNPHELGRVEGYWITSLPGTGRVSFWSKMFRRVLSVMRTYGRKSYYGLRHFLYEKTTLHVYAYAAKTAQSADRFLESLEVFLFDDADYYPVISQVDGAVDRRMCETRFKHGDRCCVAFYEKKPVFFCWISFKQMRMAEIRHSYKLANGEACIYHCYTVTEYRRKGVYSCMLTNICRRLQSEGTSRIYIYAAEHNVSSNRGILRAGFSAVSQILYRSVMGRRSYQEKVAAGAVSRFAPV